MRFEKNKQRFLKICCKCDKQFEDESEWIAHRKVCKGGGKSLDFAKDKKDLVIKEQTVKKFEDTLKEETISEENEVEDTDNDFSDVDKITENTKQTIKKTEEIIEKVENLVENKVDEEETSQEIIEEETISEDTEVEDTDLTEILPVEEKVEPVKKPRSMRRRNTSKKKSK
jgi:hypothetical protein